jgi:Vitamin K-dependent gamma-carboxylase
LVYLLALWLGRCDAVWAVSANMPNAERPLISTFAPRLLRFQTVALYLGAGLWKAANGGWQSGVLLASTMQGIWATPLAFWIVRQGITPQGWATLSHVVIVGELLIAVLLWVPRTRYVGMALGAAFHLGNTVILAIPEFLVCLAPYLLFVPEAHFERLAARLQQRCFRTRSRANA